MEFNGRILVIDDDTAILETYQDILDQDHHEDSFITDNDLFENIDPEINITVDQYDVKLFSKPDLGIREIQIAQDAHNPFAVAFIDMKMPGMDGVETAKQIWMIDPDIKIVIVTAYTEYAVNDIINMLGRQDILLLRKPFYPEEIRQLSKTLTQNWNLEQAEKQHRKRLEKAVAERTSELKKKNDRLRQLDKEKSNFIGYLSHEINTPLNWISATDIMDKEELNKNNTEMIKLIDKGVERISGLMSAMVSYFQISDPERKINFKKILLDEEIKSSIAEYENDIQRKQLKIQVEIQKGKSIHADPGLFKILASALISNAVMFSESGGTVRICASCEKGNVLFSIRDQGCGIDPDRINDIFNPFSNLEAARHGNQGFGLSLPKAKAIADLHKWDIRAWSSGAYKETGFAVLMKDKGCLLEKI